MKFGKFESAEELLKGYTELEKSYTRKCQELSKLRSDSSGETDMVTESNNNITNEPVAEAADVTDTAISGTSVETPPQQQAQSTTVDSVESVPQEDGVDAEPTSLPDQAPCENPTEAQLQQYLNDHPEVVAKLLHAVSAEFAPTVMTGGGNVPLTLPSRPKTIKEASVMARDLFKN